MARVRTGKAAVEAAIARYRPRSLDAEVARFARDVVTAARPHSTARAKALLFAAGRLGAFGRSVGLELCGEVLLRPSVIERYVATAGAALSAPARLTLRSNLRSLAQAVAPAPGPVPLSRGRAKTAYSEAEMAAYFALARAQRTEARRMRTSGLLCLGAGAGLMGADLRGVRGTDVVSRSGGLVVEVHGSRPRVVPVLGHYHDDLVSSAGFAGERYVIGGRSADRRTVTTPLVSSLAGGVDLPRLDTGRLRSTWLVAVTDALGLKAFMDAAGVTCSQRLGDLVSHLASPAEERAVTLLSGR